jgi:hypothetical protein
MGLVSDLLGLIRGSQDPVTTVMDIETALDQLHDERENAHARLAALAEKRRAALMSDATTDAIRKIDDECDAARLLVERLDLLEPQLLDKLQHARGDARRQEWYHLYAEHHKLALNFADAMRKTCDALDRLVVSSDKLRARGFETEWRSCNVFPPNVLNKELTEQFLLDVERAHDAEIARQEGRNIVPMIAEPAPPRRPLLAPAKPAEPAPRPTRTPIRQEAAAGQILCRVVRPGYEFGGAQFTTGDIVALDEPTARRAIENGALDLETDQAAE